MTTRIITVSSIPTTPTVVISARPQPRRRTVSFIPTTPDVPDGDVLEGLRNSSNPAELQNIDELRRKTLAKLYTATGYKGIKDDWFETQTIDGVEETVLTSGKARKVALLPNPQQIGFTKRIEKSDTLLEDEIDSTSDNVRSLEGKTYSVINHPLLQYTGPNSTGMNIIAVTGAAAILAGSAAFAQFLNLISASSKKIPSLLSGGLTKFLGLPDSVFPVGECINRGVPILLGLNITIKNPADIAGVLTQLLLAISSGDSGGTNLVPLSESPGFYAHMFRLVVQGTEELKRTSSRLNVRQLSVSNVRSFVDSIKSLGIFKFLILAANLGNEILKRERGITEENLDAVSLPSADNRGNRGLSGKERISRSRLSDGSKGGKRMSTSLRDLPGAHLPPATARSIQNYISVADKFEPKLGESGENKRILRSLKNTLEKEYVPFWIQDMRTGEVSAFHAFLLSAKDSFSPTVESTSTLGRMDDVLTLTRTKRSVGCEFILVATSPDEHDYLWYLVNWLTMLIYPTWSEGIEIGNGRTSPFGRVPSASPLVRIRLGDMWRSNAGSESLSRLLTPEKELQVKIDKAKKDWGAQAKPKAVETRTNAWEFAIGGQYTLFPNPLGYVYETVIGNVIGNTGRVLKTNENTIFECERVIDSGEVAIGKVYKINSEGKKGGELTTSFSVRVTRRDVQPFFPRNVRLTTVQASETLNALTNAASSIFGTGAAVFGGPAVLPAAQSATRAVNRATNSLNSLFERVNVIRSFSSRAEVADFDSLPFVKALRNGALDGLAGMIDSFEVDYSWMSADSFGLETTPGSIAPFGVKINLSMSVIHDIQPGRDSMGRNRAPIYPVGRINNDSVGKFYAEDFYEDNNAGSETRAERAVNQFGRQVVQSIGNALGLSSNEEGNAEGLTSEVVPKGDGRKPFVE